MGGVWGPWGPRTNDDEYTPNEKFSWKGTIGKFSGVSDKIFKTILVAPKLELILIIVVTFCLSSSSTQRNACPFGPSLLAAPQRQQRPHSWALAEPSVTLPKAASSMRSSGNILLFFAHRRSSATICYHRINQAALILCLVLVAEWTDATRRTAQIRPSSSFFSILVSSIWLKLWVGDKFWDLSRLPIFRDERTDPARHSITFLFVLTKRWKIFMSHYSSTIIKYTDNRRLMHYKSPF